MPGVRLVTLFPGARRLLERRPQPLQIDAQQAAVALHDALQGRLAARRRQRQRVDGLVAAAGHRAHVGAPAFLLLPLAMKGAPFALIYADKATPGDIDLDEKELNLLRTLRNQAVMAFRQAA